jgi:hypothetical protein
MRDSSALIYDVSTQNFVLFGGTINSNPDYGDTWSLPLSGFGISITECNSTNATTLGLPVPQTATPPIVVLSAYFQPLPQATPVIRHFEMQLDWYNQQGAFISSTVGSSITEIAGQWVRAFVVGTPPAGAAYIGRSARTVSTAIAGDLHFMSAVQTEYNTLATPGPTAWSPPRDLWFNLLPTRQNLLVNTQGLAGTFGWSASVGSIASSAAAITWPEGSTAGFDLTFSGTAGTYAAARVPVNPNVAYTASLWLRQVLFGNAANWVLSISWYTANNSLISTVTGLALSGVPSTFVQMSVVNKTAPANAAWAVLTLAGTGSSGSPSWYMGAPLFEPSAFLSPFFDGNFSPAGDYTFEGTVNESISDFYPEFATRLSRFVTVMPNYLPIGSTFSVYSGQMALQNAGLVG